MRCRGRNAAAHKDSQCVEAALQEGLANVCLVGSSATVQKAKVESSIPRKRGAAAAGYDRALRSFFDKVGLQAPSDCPPYVSSLQWPSWQEKDPGPMILRF